VLKLNFSTIRYVIKKQEETGTIENKARSGSPKVLTSRERRQIVHQTDKEPFKSAVSLADDIAAQSNKRVSPQTIRNVLHSANTW
jgi:transposase